MGNIKSEDDMFFWHPHLIPTNFHPHIFSKSLYFRLPPHPGGVQTCQFSYCSLVMASRLTLWIFTFLNHHFVYLTSWDLETVEKPDGGLTREAHGCVLRATGQIIEIRTKWNSLLDTFKESLAPVADKMKSAEPGNALGLSSGQHTWPRVSFSFSDQQTAQAWSRRITSPGIRGGRDHANHWLIFFMYDKVTQPAKKTF